MVRSEKNAEGPNTNLQMSEKFKDMVRVRLIATGNYNKAYLFLNYITKLEFYSFLNSVSFLSIS